MQFYNTQHNRTEARAMTRAFIDDNPVPECPLAREARFAVIKGILGGIFTYADGLKPTSFVRGERMPRIRMLPDIKVPWREASFVEPESAPGHDLRVNVQYINGNGHDDGGKKAVRIPPVPAPSQPIRIEF